MKFQNVVVAGGGVLGSQIAFQSAYCGCQVCIWLRSPESVERTRVKLKQVRDSYLNDIRAMRDDPKAPWAIGIADREGFDADECMRHVEAAYENLKLETDLQKALADADLVIESMAEIREAKHELYKKMAPILPEKTIVVTNSSTLLPSEFAADTGRPEKYLALHFANRIWHHNAAEVMGHDGTDPAVFDDVLQFASEIRMLPLPVRKEKNGYLLNSMSVPFLLSALDLYANGVSDPVSIDLAWTHGNGAPVGPFAVMDVVGLVTVANIVSQFTAVPDSLTPVLKKMMMPYNYKGMLELLQRYINEGKLGRMAGEGFYRYDTSKGLGKANDVH